MLAETGGFDDFIWGLNGGATTARGFDRLPPEELGELVDWIAHLPLFAVVETDERPWILVHAGIDALEARGYLATAGVAVSDEEGAAAATADDLRAMMASQDPRRSCGRARSSGAFRRVLWGRTAGALWWLPGTRPRSTSSTSPTRRHARGVNEDGLGQMVPVGACTATGGVADRIDIDCSAAAGAGQGRVGVRRLEDGAVFYAAIEPGE